MANIPAYSSRNFEVAYGGVSLVGLAPDSFIEFSLSSDITDEEVGADGSVAISFSPDDTGTCTVSLLQNSPSNITLSGLINLQKIEGTIAKQNLEITDPSGSVVAVLKNAHLKTAPTVTRGMTATGSTMAWVFFCEEIRFQAVAPENANAAQLVVDAIAAVDLFNDYLLK